MLKQSYNNENAATYISLKKKKKDVFPFLPEIAVTLIRLPSARSSTRHTRIDSCTYKPYCSTVNAPFTKINSKIQNNLLKSFAAGFWTTYKRQHTEKINPCGSIRSSIINVHLKDL